MCNIDQFIVLSESDDSQVTWCKTCKTFSLSYKCFCASFDTKEFERFSQILEDLSERDFYYKFMGESHTVVKSSMANMGFCLTKKDAKAVRNLLKEAHVMFDAFKIIYT